MNRDLKNLAQQTLETALSSGAHEVAVWVSKKRFISLEVRDGQLDKIQESFSSGLAFSLYVDGRSSTHHTSDLRWDSLRWLVDEAMSLTRHLDPDPCKGLADPELYRDRPANDLGIYDGGHEDLDTQTRLELAHALETGAREVTGPIISVTTNVSDSMGESYRLHSNGFEGTRRSTSYWMNASVSVQDLDGRKPMDWHMAGARVFSDLPDPISVGASATKRALARLGQVRLPSSKTAIILGNRAAGHLLEQFVGVMAGYALYRERSFLVNMQGKQVGSSHFTLCDDPLLYRGFGSRHYDRDGISARCRNLVEKGILKNYLIGVYYGRKLGRPPTSGSASNLVLPPGDKSSRELIAGVSHGLFIDKLMGGNANSTAGDFSVGIVGFEIDQGRIGRPIGEMNLSGNHKDLWHRLVAVGNDPYPYSSWRIPSLVFENVSISGT